MFLSLSFSSIHLLVFLYSSISLLLFLFNVVVIFPFSSSLLHLPFAAASSCLPSSIPSLPLLYLNETIPITLPARSSTGGGGEKANSRRPLWDLLNYTRAEITRTNTLIAHLNHAPPHVSPQQRKSLSTTLQLHMQNVTLRHMTNSEPNTRLHTN